MKKEYRLSTGTYNTKDYSSVLYTSEASLINAVRSLGYIGEIYSGLTFNHYGIKYKVSFN